MSKWNILDVIYSGENTLKEEDLTSSVEFVTPIECLLDFEETEKIDDKILEERNERIREIEKSIIETEEIIKSLNEMIYKQGEEIIVVEKNIYTASDNTEESVIYLQDTEAIREKRLKVIRDIAIVSGGVVMGALGFIASPIIGAATLVSGLTLGSGIVIGKRKYESIN